MLVAGGGIGGLTAALCLARAGWRVVVFEQSQTFGELGAGIQITPNAANVLRHLGLQSSLRTCASQPAAIEFRHWRTGKVVGVVRLGEAAISAYGHPYYHIHRGDLLRILVEAAERSPGVELRAGAQVRGFRRQDAGVRVAVADGVAEREREGVALIGADGVHSAVRTALFGAESPTFTGNVAWRVLVPTTRLAPGDARTAAGVWFGPGRHFVHYPVRGGELMNCVGVVRKSGWTVESWVEPGDHAEFQADFAGWHGDVQALIDNADRGSLHKWALYDRRPLRDWGDGPATLLGDACHPTLPFLAQGAAMAVEDAAVLASCLGTGQPEAALRRYEKLRQARTAMVQRLSRRNAKLFHLPAGVAWLRDRALRFGLRATAARIFRYDALRAVR